MMKTSGFNTYYDNIDTHFWRNLYVEKGVFRYYEKEELFAEEAHIAKYLGYIKSGSLKYVVYAPDGSEKGDWTNLMIYNKPACRFVSNPTFRAPYIGFRLT